MKKIELKEVDHNVKIGQSCEYKEPNIINDCIFTHGGKNVGFYIRKPNDKIIKLANLANHLLNTDDVPKSRMSRKPTDGWDEVNQRWKYKNEVYQYSTILGSIPPKPHMRRPYPSISSVHRKKSAEKFIKAMLLLCYESEKLMKQVLPEQYEHQLELLKKVPEKFRFGNLFTSSISNFNISADFHRDTGNIVGANNIIITKKHNAVGGDLHIPDYDATINSENNSILCYPAWRNIHGVTPIKTMNDKGYRNSLIFYPLKAFVED